MKPIQLLIYALMISVSSSVVAQSNDEMAFTSSSPNASKFLKQWCIALADTKTTAARTSLPKEVGSSLQIAAQKWKQAMETKDVAGIIGAFSQDVITMYPHPLPIYGREANKEIWEGVYKDPIAEHPVTVDQVTVSDSGELGYILGKWWHSNANKNHSSGGRYVAIWKKIEDQWQIIMLSAHAHDDIKAAYNSK